MELGDGKVAVVTGAAGGIGLALAEAFAQTGMAVVLSDILDDKLAAAEETVAAHGGATLRVTTDVSSQASVDELAAATLERFGAVHVVCNNAGVVGADLDPWMSRTDAWTRTFGVNVFGIVHGVRAFLPHLLGGGHIVNTASIAGHLPAFGGVYSASKAAAVSLSESLYTTMQAQGLPVGVTCLCPGWVRTDLMRNEAATNDAPGVGVVMDLFSSTLDEGTPPARIADETLDAVRDDRFWVFPHQDFLDLAIERFHSIAERRDPQPPGQLPGAPSTDEVMGAVLSALEDLGG